MRLSLLSLALILALASCVALPREVPVLPAAAAPLPEPAPVPPPPSKDWRDWALTPGVWRYQPQGTSSVATFGVAGAPPVLTLHCAMPSRRVSFLTTHGTNAGQMIVRTTFGTAQWPLQATGNPGAFAAIRAAGDATLDQIAFSRGRFVLEMPGAKPLVLPTWAEVTRVIEDCRA